MDETYRSLSPCRGLFDYAEWEERGHWSQLLLQTPAGEIAVQCVRLTAAPPPLWRQSDGGSWAWAVIGSGDEWPARQALVTLWGVSLAGRVNAPPVIVTDEEAISLPRSDDALALRVDWPWLDYHWRLKVDLLAEEPLQEIGGKEAQRPER